MDEILLARMKTHAAVMIQAMAADPMRMPAPQAFEGGQIVPQRFPGFITGMIAAADKPQQLTVWFHQIMGDWYCTLLDEDWLAKQAVVEQMQVSEDQTITWQPIGWIRLKPDGKFNYYSNLMGSEMENYEHPDLTETVMKLAVVHQMAQNRTR